MRGVKKLSPDTESHIVSAYDPHLQLVLSMDAVPVKRNELDAIRRLLDELDVTDALITIDAIGCQHDVAAQVLEAITCFRSKAINRPCYKNWRTVSQTYLKVTR